MRILRSLVVVLSLSLMVASTAYAHGGPRGSRGAQSSRVQRIVDTFKAGLRRIFGGTDAHAKPSETTCGIGCARREGAAAAAKPERPTPPAAATAKPERPAPPAVAPAKPERPAPPAVAPARSEPRTAPSSMGRRIAVAERGPVAREREAAQPQRATPRPPADRPAHEVEPQPSASRPPARPTPLPDGYQPYELTTGRAQHPPTILFLHGAGQKPKNGVLERLAEGMRSERVSARFVSVAHERDRNAVERFLAEHEGPVIIAGHSAGGARAMAYAERYADRIIGAILVNPAARVNGASVPTLLLRGTNDYAGWTNESGKNVTAYAVKGSDHSLRFREPRQQDKTAHEQTPETRSMNRGVAQQVKSFLRDLPGPERTR